MEFNSHPLEASGFIAFLKLERPGKDQLFRSLNRRYGDYLMDDKYWYWITPCRVPAEERVIIRLSRELDLTVFSDNKKQQADACDYLLKFDIFVRRATATSLVRPIGNSY